MFGPPNGSGGIDTLSCALPAIPSINDEIEFLQSLCTSTDSIGIVVRACAEALRAKKLFEKSGAISLSISAQFVEIYNETISDLLSSSPNQRVQVRRGTGEVVGAADCPINSLGDIVSALNAGNMRKQFAATAMNERSSRSHTALILHFSQQNHNTQTMVKSSLYLVDLAGSERVKKSKATGVQFDEARAINNSLLVLGKVIRRLSRSETHVPYYESLLTMLLKGAFGGNSKTGVIVTCRSDDRQHGDETLQTLRFGELCSTISNSTKMAATSVTDALDCINTAVGEVEAQIELLRLRGKSNLASFAALEGRLFELKSKRTTIIALSSGGKEMK